MSFKTIFCNLIILSIILCSSAALAEQKSEAMSTKQAVILGVVEGLTEYLPVSSTGHLLLAERVMAIGSSDNQTTAKRAQTKEALDAYTICIQAGAIIAVLGLYFRRVLQMLLGVMGKDSEGRQMFINVVAGFMPAAVIGLLFNKIIKSYLFGTWPTVIAWFVGGVAILAVSWRRKRCQTNSDSGKTLEELTWKMAVIIGFAQCIAMWPGVSRSLATIVAGVMVGMSMSAAVEYSFLLGVVTLSAATAYDTLKHGQIMLETFSISSMTIGLIFSFIAAVVSVKWMVSYLNKNGLAIFGYYRVALAITVAAFLLV